MEGTDLLQISPTQLDYVFVSNTELKQTISLRNTLTDGRNVAFKVKTSAVSRYMVRPTVGIVPAGRSVNVRIYMVPQPQYSDDLRSCKDRFLIQCVPTEAASVGDLTSDTFVVNNRQDVKLHVSVVGTDTLPYPMSIPVNLPAVRLLVKDRPGLLGLASNAYKLVLDGRR